MNKPIGIGHEAADAKRLMGMHLRFHTKSWSDCFMCPKCGASKRYNLNYLGYSRKVVCDGTKIKAVSCE